MAMEMCTIDMWVVAVATQCQHGCHHRTKIAKHISKITINAKTPSEKKETRISTARQKIRYARAQKSLISSFSSAIFVWLAARKSNTRIGNQLRLQTYGECRKQNLNICLYCGIKLLLRSNRINNLFKIFFIDVTHSRHRSTTMRNVLCAKWKEGNN